MLPSSDEEFFIQNKEEIAEEFGVFQTLSERDFFTYHLLKKAKKEKEKVEKQRKQSEQKEDGEEV